MMKRKFKTVTETDLHSMPDSKKVKNHCVDQRYLERNHDVEKKKKKKRSIEWK